MSARSEQVPSRSRHCFPIFDKELRIGIAPESINENSVFLAIIAMRTKSGNGDMDRYRGEYVLKVQGPKGQKCVRGRLKDRSAG